MGPRVDFGKHRDSLDKRATIGAVAMLWSLVMWSSAVWAAGKEADSQANST
jgi:hypothetical protein